MIIKFSSNFNKVKEQISSLNGKKLTRMSGIQIQVRPNLIYCIWD